jgi:hypothetical protein
VGEEGVDAGVKARSGASLDVIPSRCGGSDRAVSRRPRPAVLCVHAAERAHELGTTRGVQAGERRAPGPLDRGRAREHGRAGAMAGWAGLRLWAESEAPAH